MRLLFASLAIFAAAPFPVDAQWTVTVQGGFHADRLARPQRVLEDGPRAMYSARGEAPSIGLRAVHWNRAHFGIDLGITVSQNKSWAGISQTGSASFVKRTAFTSVAAVWRPTSPESRLQLRLGLGPSIVLHQGTGESLMTRNVDFGIVATGGASITINPRLQLGIDVYNYRFRSQFKEWWQEPDGTYRFPAGSAGRSELVVMPALRIRL